MIERRDTERRDIDRPDAGTARPHTSVGGTHRDLMRADGVGVVRQGRQVLQDVNCIVRGGEVLALVGPNGGGKTTLIQVLLGLIRPDAGSMTWFDAEGRGRPVPQGNVGYVAQRVRADLRYPLTVCEVVGMALRRGRPLWSRFSRQDHEEVHRALERMRILHLADRLAGRLSGGQQQRMFLARALVHDPELLFLDEPTTGIDAAGRDELLALIADLRSRTGVGIVLATHEDQHVTELADRVLTIDGTVRPLETQRIAHPGPDRHGPRAEDRP